MSFNMVYGERRISKEVGAIIVAYCKEKLSCQDFVEKLPFVLNEVE
jgi:hypothetical protein